MQAGGANTNANNNGLKWQRMNTYYNHVLCVVSVLLLLFSLLLVFAPHIETNQLKFTQIHSKAEVQLQLV